MHNRLDCKNIEIRKVAQLKVHKSLRYFAVSMSAILLSMFFPVAEWQLLTISIITGIKWIVDSNSKAIRIILEERRW